MRWCGAGAWRRPWWSEGQEGGYRGVAGEIVRPILGPNLSALGAAGPACGCPDLFLTNLSTAEAGCRSEPGEADGPKGEAQDAPNNLGGFSPSHHRQKGKTPHMGAFCLSGGEGGTTNSTLKANAGKDLDAFLARVE